MTAQTFKKGDRVHNIKVNKNYSSMIFEWDEEKRRIYNGNTDIYPRGW